MAINDVTYLLDESLQLIRKIHDIESEMENKDEWEATSMVRQRERQRDDRATFLCLNVALLGDTHEQDATAQSI